MSDYLNSLIGIPFVENGRSREGVDCYGLILLVAREHFKSDPPDWQHEFTARAIVSQMENELAGERIAGEAVELDAPVDWSVVTVARKHKAYHMGLCLHGGVLHVARGSGVIFQRRSEFEKDYASGKLRYWSWRHLSF